MRSTRSEAKAHAFCRIFSRKGVFVNRERAARTTEPPGLRDYADLQQRSS
jgi:hypothetical protein